MESFAKKLLGKFRNRAEQKEDSFAVFEKCRSETREIKVFRNATGTLLTGPENTPGSQVSELQDETLYRIVRTPTFKKWFGDWGQDESGGGAVHATTREPRVVYHGTPAEVSLKEGLKPMHFSTVGAHVDIRTRKRHKRRVDEVTKVFFSSDASDAYEWGKKRAETQEENSAVYPAFIKIEEREGDTARDLGDVVHYAVAKKAHIMQLPYLPVSTKGQG